jgi:hypothetical protein
MTGTTRLTDVIIPKVYQSYTAVDSPEKTAFFESGIVVRNSMLDQKANEGGDTINVPFWNDLDSSVAPNLSNDNPASLATPNKINAGRQVARMAYLNQWYSNADLASELAGSNANQQVRNRFGTYWMRQWQRRLIATTRGIIADNIANNAGDMGKVVAAEATGSQTALTRFNRDVFTDAVYSMGDMADKLGAIAVHSAIMAQMVKNDDIDYIPDSQGRMTIPTYMGLRVIVDDNMPVQAGTTSGFKYTSVIFGQGAFGYGEGTPLVPVETKREALQGNGAGVEYIGERKSWLLHPFGFQVGTAPAEITYSLAELTNASSIGRVLERKNIPLAYIVSN